MAYNLALNLRLFRLSKNWTQTEMAEALKRAGIPASLRSVQRWEAGEVEPPAWKVSELRNYFAGKLGQTDGGSADQEALEMVALAIQALQAEIERLQKKLDET